MRIALYFDDKSFKGKDFRYPEKGNPGVGGTPYCFLMLAKYYSITYQNDNIFFYHQVENFQNKYSTEYKAVRVNPTNIAEQCIKDKIDFLVLTLSRYRSSVDSLEKQGVKCIVWVHNFLTYDNLLLLRRNLSATRVVFVGKEQYDRYIDDPVIKKSVCIMNMFNTECADYVRTDSHTKNVTYVGAIVPGKGFHYLAKCWKTILKAVPDAELYVMGSGALYDNGKKLGKYGIAEEAYEKQFIKYLLDDSGKIIPSVHFLGIVSAEKINHFQKTRVGIVNPTARTEICPISVLEMASCGIPVVSKNKNGMPDVIKNGVTGILVNNSSDFCSAVTKLLLNNDLNLSYGSAAKIFVKQRFNPSKIVKEWHVLFEEINNNVPSIYQRPTGNYMNNYKFLRMLNKFLRNIPLMKWLPSIAFIECKIKSIL